MKTSIAVLVGTVLLANCPWALAAGTADLFVKGQIVPSACTPSLERGGVIELGKLSHRDISEAGMTELPEVLIGMEVNCQGPTLFALTPQDNRPQMYTPMAFGFAKLASGAPIGGYWLDAGTMRADGAATSRLYSRDNGAGWIPADERAPIEPQQLNAFGDRSSGAWAPQPIQLLELGLRVNAFFYPGNTWLPANEEVRVDGSSTFELRYL